MRSRTALSPARVVSKAAVTSENAGSGRMP